MILSYASYLEDIQERWDRDLDLNVRRRPSVPDALASAVTYYRRRARVGLAQACTGRHSVALRSGSRPASSASTANRSCSRPSDRASRAKYYQVTRHRSLTKPELRNSAERALIHFSRSGRVPCLDRKSTR